MNDIHAPISNTPLVTGDGAARVTRASSTSDDSSAQQQPNDKKSPAPEKLQDTKEKTTSYDTAVTISASLANLEKGSKISATYLGIDGQDRPLISSETGTYVIKYDVSYQKDIEKIPPNVLLSVKILKLDREIEARLIYSPPPNTTASGNPPLSIAVTLELTALGSAPPKIRTPIDQNPLPIEQQQISYRTTDIFRAEKIARDSANKLNELPLPATTTNYTLYERATPQQSRPAATIQSSIAGNGLIAQEQIVKLSPQVGGPVQGQGQAQASVATAQINLEKLLHVNLLATVVKNIPKEAINLPDIVQKQLGQTSPLDNSLDNIKAGRNFTLRIESVAIPDIQAQNPTQIPTSENKINPLPESVKEPVPKSASTSGPVQSFWGIVIDPAKNIMQQNTNIANSAAPAQTNKNNRYPGQYMQTSQPNPAASNSGAPNELISLYIATPVSVIRIQSPIELKAGTVINFNLPPPQTSQVSQADVKSSQKLEPQVNTNPQVNTSTSTAQENLPTGLSAAAQTVSPSAPSVTAMQIPPQPLENFVQNWQSLSQLLSIIPPPVDAASPAHILGNRIPSLQSPAQMTSSMIFFLAALGAKNPARVWLGPAVTQRIERLGQVKLLNMLNSDMKRIFRLGAETTVNDWRPALIPMQVGTDVQAIPILTRQLIDEEADKNNKSPEDDDKKVATRFIVELNLSQIGKIQVDGLLKETTLNIIIRSKAILPTEMKKDLSDKFITSLEISGFAGDLQFRDNIAPDISVQNIINQKIHMLKA
ncbi:hypothetical protein MNBD_ALPHA03-497 [hydrothermal vent metagenome]|uniref:Uncharacterized protein n=1 Tax=hydrothermal vent metagenome TaxID=652676 RepID=A0A3B1ARI8_9ZZZZ